MATFRRYQLFFKANNDTGFWTNPSDYGDGLLTGWQFSIFAKPGCLFLNSFSLFHSILQHAYLEICVRDRGVFLSINFVHAVRLLFGSGPRALPA